MIKVFLTNQQVLHMRFFLQCLLPKSLSLFIFTSVFELLGPHFASDLKWSVCPSICPFVFPSEIFCPEHKLSSLDSIWPMLHRQSAFRQRVCSDLEWSFYVNGQCSRSYQTMQKSLFRAYIYTLPRGLSGSKFTLTDYRVKGVRWP